MRVVVVGAGLSGLSAACHLVGRGHDVTVIERAPGPGGLAGQLRSHGYTLDTGPSVLTMPDILAATFTAAGASLQDHVHLRPVDPAYRACFAGAEPLYARAGRAAMGAEIAARCGPGDAAGFERFCDWLERLYRVEQPNFIERNYDSPLDLVRPVGPAWELLRLGAFGRLAATVDRHVRDPRLRQLLSFQALYAGLSPFEALAVYCVITYMDIVAGVWFPVGGIHAIAAGLAEAAGKRGAAVVYDRRVTRITQRRGRSGPVSGVRLDDGDTVRADAVVATVDRATVYAQLLGERPGRRVRRGRYAPSCVLWVAGVRGSLPGGASHHNVHFPARYRPTFDALVRGGTRPSDPATLVSVPTLTDAGLAPPGGHVLYALEPVANLDGSIDWAAEGQQAREQLRERLDGWGYPVRDVVTEHFMDPLDWEAAGLTRGTPFSLAHRFFQSGPFRPPNIDPRIPGLVLAGAGTVPGVGIPMVLTSGRLAADRVEQLASAP